MVNTMMDFDVAVIGGGAAGLAAACFLGRAAAEQSVAKRVLVLEKAPRVGKKLLATGNGTCNITNMHAAERHYHGAPAVAATALGAFSPSQAMDFFRSVGVDCLVREDGKVYPYSEQAAAVLDALRLECAALGVEIRCDAAVTAIRPMRDGYTLTVGDASLTARQVLVCVGGAASPSLGGSAEGYSLLTALGYTKTPLFPSIVQVRTETDFVRAVKGIRVDATVSLWRDGKQAAVNSGEVLFTEYGISGPAVMQISRAVGDWERRKSGRLVACLDLLPAWDEEVLCTRVAERSRMAGRTLEDLLTGLLHKRVGQTVLRVAGVLPLTRETNTLTAEECSRIARTIKRWELPVTGTHGFGGAQVTAGGIDPAAFDVNTLMSRRHDGLFAAGEVLDVDGDCGGYNLQFAWSSAYVAASAIAARW